MKSLNQIIILAGIIIFLANCSTKTGSNQETTEEPKDTLILEAENLYSTYCSGCHGQQMQAFVDRKWKHGKEATEIRASIVEGYAEAGMPAWGEAFKPYQIDALVSYIQDGIEEVEKYGFEAERLTSDTVDTEDYTIILDTVFTGIEIPWDMTWLPNGDMLVTERSGTLYRVAPNGDAYKIKGVPPVRVKNQDGLFEVLLHPDFEKNNWLYLSYSDLKVEGSDSLTTTKVSRFDFADDQLSNPLTILEASPYTTKQYHFGARMTFDNNGFLFITVGDRAERDINPQDLTKMAGKIHRVNDDGSFPSDNPYYGNDTIPNSIFSYGHRNPQGIAVHPETGKIWSHEHGPRGGDEINIIHEGRNYGWPVISYGINYDGTIFTNELEKEGMEQPLHYWVPSIAPCGMIFVTSDRYPEWKGDILSGSLRFEYLNRSVVQGNSVSREEKLLKQVGRVRNVEQGPDGYIYISVEKPGHIFRLTPLRNTKSS